MSQGVVIAVKPSYTGGLEPKAMRSMQQTHDSRYQEKDRTRNLDLNLLIIGECKVKNHKCDKKNLKNIVWYEDAENKFEVGDYVEFEVDRRKQKEFNGVIRIKKISSGKSHLPEEIFTKVIVIASLLLLGFLVKDKRRE